MNLPEPMSPPECDLRGYDFMPLFGAKLFGSEFNAIANDAEFRAAINLWWSCWLAKPAGSVPNEDRQLAMMAGFGRDVKGWMKVRKMALHGFVECSDGRLYHPTIATEAVSAFEKRLKSDKKREQDRKRLQDWRDAQATKRGSNDSGNGGTSDGETPHETRFETPNETDETDVKRVSSQVDSDSDSDRTKILPSVVARGTRLPDDWRPDEDDCAYAASRGLDPARIAEDFRGYWLAKAGKDARKTDWKLTWQGWCRRDADRAGQRKTSAPQAKTSNLAWMLPGNEQVGLTIDGEAWH